MIASVRSEDVLTGYALAISKATAVTDRALLARIEECMRSDIFHSTLDWQTLRQFNKGAVEAYELIKLIDRGASHADA